MWTLADDKCDTRKPIINADTDEDKCGHLEVEDNVDTWMQRINVDT